MQTMTKEMYRDVLARLLTRIQRVCPALCATKDFFLLHDNARPHTTALVQQFLASKSVSALHHPSYSPDLSLPDYFAFQRLKLLVKGRRFEDIPTIDRNVTAALKTIPQKDFERALQGLEARAQHCVDSNGCILNKKNLLFFWTPFSLFSKRSPETLLSDLVRLPFTNSQLGMIPKQQSSSVTSIATAAHGDTSKQMQVKRQ